MSQNNEIHRELTKWQQGLFKPYRYKVIHGGRGSGKSYAVADALILESLYSKHLVLCGREFQNSIKDSVHSLLQQRIDALNLTKYFEITRDEINCTYSGSRFIFKGLRHNIDSIKSMAGITRLWIEEADTLSAESWRIIEPTIREPNSEIWCTFNPKNKTDILYRTFIESQPPTNAYVAKVNYADNPHFPEVLAEQMERQKLKDYGMYQHVWLGECLEHSDAQIFKGYWIESNFEEQEGMYKYFGLDFGFAQDPTAGIRCYIHNNILYITHEAVKYSLEIDETAKFLEARLPDLRKHTIYADNARPESISFIKRQGYSIKAVEKGKGSIEDGIEYIKSFDKVIIHPRCKETIREFTLYSYEVDERSGDITNKIVDKNNHCLVGDTLVDTTNGQFRIKDLVGKTGFVNSLDCMGLVVKNRFHDVRLTQEKADVFKISLANGKEIICTKDHLFLTLNRGWRHLKDIYVGEDICCISDALRYNVDVNKKEIQWQNTSTLTRTNILGMRKQAIIETARCVKHYIGKYINTIADIFQMVIIYTMLIMINLIMILKTSFASVLENIVNIILKTGRMLQKLRSRLTLIKLDLLQKIGTHRKKVMSGTRNSGKGVYCHLFLRELNNIVHIARKNMNCLNQRSREVDSVATVVNQKTEEFKDWIIFKKNVLYVVQNLHQISILKSKHAIIAAGLHSVTVTGIEKVDNCDVYNMEVENNHNYTIEGGIITHNCIDGLRYSLERLMKNSSIDYSKWKKAI